MTQTQLADFEARPVETDGGRSVDDVDADPAACRCDDCTRFIETGRGLPCWPTWSDVGGGD